MEGFDAEGFVRSVLEDEPRGRATLTSTLWEAPAAAGPGDTWGLASEGSIGTLVGHAAKLFIHPGNPVDAAPEGAWKAPPPGQGTPWVPATAAPSPDCVSMADMLYGMDTAVAAMEQPLPLTTPPQVPHVPGEETWALEANNPAGPRAQGRGMTAPWAPARGTGDARRLYNLLPCAGNNPVAATTTWGPYLAPVDLRAGGGGAAVPAAAVTAAAVEALQVDETLEYADDLHAFLRAQERRHTLPGGGDALYVSAETRTDMVDWVSTLHKRAAAAAAAAAAAIADAPSSSSSSSSSPATFFLAVNLLDRFLTTAEGRRVAAAGLRELHLAGLAALSLASKYEDVDPLTLATLQAAVAALATTGGGEAPAAKGEAASMEARLGAALGFRMTVPTAQSFLGAYLQQSARLGPLPPLSGAEEGGSGGAGGAVAEKVARVAGHACRRMVRHPASLRHLPSELAAAAVYVSCRMVLGASAAAPGPWLERVTGYGLGELYTCLSDMEAVLACLDGGDGGAGGGGGGGARCHSYTPPVPDVATLSAMGHAAIAAL